ncbi:PREDICTED: uncharacterized protein LOC105508389 [Colobus angolensis palliatus]|uniref:uncharacterized protein LOC105508389 n=1 Tax=Colobus angolensis palliatus TaxID=336983 RepID=UPI0005F3F12C|nr:PREDICTED: uncharacterized protein LOC105508389 [Colobus angolensis palliatus]
MLKQNKEVKTESEMGKTSPHKSSTGCENSVSLVLEALKSKTKVAAACVSAVSLSGIRNATTVDRTPFKRETIYAQVLKNSHEYKKKVQLVYKEGVPSLKCLVTADNTCKTDHLLPKR